MVIEEQAQFEEHLQALVALGHSRPSICQRLLLTDAELSRAIARLEGAPEPGVGELRAPAAATRQRTATGRRTWRRRSAMTFAAAAFSAFALVGVACSGAEARPAPTPAGPTVAAQTATAAATVSAPPVDQPTTTTPVPMKEQPLAAIKVQTGGDCLNVRGGASTSTAIVGCYPDGTEFGDPGMTRVNAEGTWIFVKTPDGKDGWANAAYLQTAGRDLTPTAAPAVAATGLPGVDPIVAALKTADAEAVMPFVQFRPTECTTATRSLGSPPACPAGVDDGTRIDVIQGSQCEGFWVTEANVADGEFDRFAAFDLQAVATTAENGQPAYRLVYANDSNPKFVTAASVYVVDGKIVSFSFGCGQSVADLLHDLGANVVYRAN